MIYDVQELLNSPLPNVVYRVSRCSLDQLLPLPLLSLKVASILEKETFSVANVAAGFPYKQDTSKLCEALEFLCDQNFLIPVVSGRPSKEKHFKFKSQIVRTVASDMLLNSHKAESRLEQMFTKMRIGRAVNRFAHKLKGRWLKKNPMHIDRSDPRHIDTNPNSFSAAYLGNMTQDSPMSHAVHLESTRGQVRSDISSGISLSAKTNTTEIVLR